MNMYTGLCYRWLLNADDHAYEIDQLMAMVTENEENENWRADALGGYIADYVNDFRAKNAAHPHAAALAFPDQIDFCEIAEKWIAR